MNLSYSTKSPKGLMYNLALNSKDSFSEVDVDNHYDLIWQSQLRNWQHYTKRD